MIKVKHNSSYLDFKESISEGTLNQGQATTGYDETGTRTALSTEVHLASKL